jgi:DNA-binding SARP family transcriptional activator/predicted ATPase
LPHLSLSLLGPFQVTLDGEPVTAFESDKVRALLAYLVVEADRPHRRESLAALLWPDWPERSARANLRNSLANLRKAIGDRDATPPFLVITRETIEFNTASDHWLDVAAFNTLVETDKTGEPAIRRLGEAVTLYHGSFLEGLSVKDSVAFDDWSLLTRERLQRRALTTLDRLVTYYERRSEYELARDYAWHQVELEPWEEEAQQRLVRLLALSGQRSAALAQYEICCRLLADELGVEPAQETTALYERIKAREISPPRPRPVHNLPAPLVPFVGREAELAEIKDRLQDPTCRLLTLFGPGGIGKTCLALEAAAGQTDHFPHGVYLVSLAPLQSVETIMPAVAQAVGFSFYSGAEGGRIVDPHQQLLEYLRQKTMLLVMDNFEHLLALPLSSPPEGGKEGGTPKGGGAVDLVTDILRTAPGVKILATSRARLGLQGEHLFPTAGLDFPGSETARRRVLSTRYAGDAAQSAPLALQDAMQYSAISLFLQSARQVQSGFELTDDVLEDVVRICRLVQGMPLAILLAGAWMRMLTPAEIGAEIEKGLDFLQAAWRDLPDRQQSMRAVFDHSWNLLTARESEVMQALSVFRGGFTRESAQQVAGARLFELMTLVDKSFLERTSAPPSAPRTWSRYEVHELLRQYAAEKLDGSPAAGDTPRAARDRHNAYFARALRQWETDLKGPRQQTALAEIEADGENVRAAWNWAVEGTQVERLERAMDGLAESYWRRGRYQEGEAAFRGASEKLAEAANLSPTTSDEKAPSGAGVPLGRMLRVLARSLSWRSYFCRALGRRELATQFQQQSLALLERPEMAGQDTRRERALLCLHMGRNVSMSDYKRAKALTEQSLALYRQLDDRSKVAEVLLLLGSIANFQGAYGEAKRAFEEGLGTYQDLGDQKGIARSIAFLASNANRRSRFEEAESLARESVAKSQELADREETAFGLVILGKTLESLGRFVEALALLEDCLAIFGDLGRSGWIGSAHVELCELHLHLGQYGRAREHGKAGLALAREGGVRYRIAQAIRLLGSLALADEAYAEAQRLMRQSVAAYQDIGERGDIARARAVYAYALRGLGQPAQAKRCLVKVLRTVTEIQALMPLLYALPAAALLMADQGEGERAMELYALASRYPFVSNSRWFEDIAGKHIAAVAARLPQDVVAAAQERGRSRDLEAVVVNLLLELAA